MIWKVIGESVIGSSHVQSGKTCEDASLYKVVQLDNDDEALICFASDGAGSAKYAREASIKSVISAVQLSCEFLKTGKDLTEDWLISIVEHIYDELQVMASASNTKCS